MLDLALALLLAAPAADLPMQDDVALVETAQPIDAAAFMAGRWVGSGLGGDAEEVWSPPAGGQMVGHFSYTKDGKAIFYEIMLIRPAAEGGLEMLVKHFNANFTAWEDKDEWVTFAAYSAGPGTVLQFDGLRAELVGDVMTITVTIAQDDGSVEDVPFVMKRAD